MTQEQKITRTENIVVDEVAINSYGDLIFTDKAGKEYPKISAKRVGFFKDVLLPGRAVQLNYAMSPFGKEYIWNAIPIEQLIKVKEPVVKTQESVTPKEQAPQAGKVLSKDEQIERAVWIKELGECLRSGEIDKTTPPGKALRNAYYTEMIRVLGINIKEVKSAKSLTEEAKKLGATEE